MVLAGAGLTPISPVIEEVLVVEIPDFARITKLPAVPRTTGAGPAAFASGTRAKTPVNTEISKDSATSVARTFLMCCSLLTEAISIEVDGDAWTSAHTDVDMTGTSAKPVPVQQLTILYSKYGTRNNKVKSLMRATQGLVPLADKHPGGCPPGLHVYCCILLQSGSMVRA